MGIEGVYIDDSGNPGADSPSVFLPESRKSWAAIIIPSSISDELKTGMSIFLRGVKEDFNADELHFTDIYSGRGVWKNVSVKKRIEIFDLIYNSQNWKCCTAKTHHFCYITFISLWQFVLFDVFESLLI